MPTPIPSAAHRPYLPLAPAVRTRSRTPLSRLDAIQLRHVLWGGAVIAAVDLVFCLAFWMPRGIGLERLWQSVAAGALGEAAFAGGWPTAALGAEIQWLIGTAFVLAYALAARSLPWLRRRRGRHGVAYGMVLYAVMLRVVVPLSAAPAPSSPDLAWVLACVPMFAVFGVLAAGYGTRATQGL